MQLCVHDPTPNDSNQLCIILHTAATATSETFIVHFIGFNTTKPHLEGGNYYVCVMQYFDFVYTYSGVQMCIISLRVAKSALEIKIVCMPNKYMPRNPA